MLPRPFVALALAFTLAAPAAHAQTVEQRIYAEGTARSGVMRHLHVLTDVHGARLTGSPSLKAAGEWALTTMQGWGMTNPTRFPWSWGHAGWENDYLAAHVVAPYRTALVAEALGWTPSTAGEVRGRAVRLVAPVNPTRAAMSAYEDSMRARVRGAIVLVGNVGTAQAAPASLQQRITDEEARTRFTPRPADAAAPATPNRPPPPPGGPRQAGTLGGAAVAARVDSFLLASGALVRVNAAGMENGLIRAFANRSFDPATAVPTVVLRDEDFGRLIRVMGDGMAPELAFDIRNTNYPGAETEHNYLAEIAGTDKAGEVVMLGGHLDSWHAATGATDNAAGSAVMMEAARILTRVFADLGERPRRTIRVGLWTGEEQGLLGSRAYVEGTFGSFENPKPAFEGFAGYFNVDSGTGRLRGASVFGPTEAAEMLDRILEPLDSLGVAGARPSFSRAIGGSDHTAFNNAGLPGIGMGQDPIAYFTTTWHTNVDTYERLLPKDLQQAAVTVALAVYRLATQEERLPRFAPADMPVAPGAARPAASSR